MRVPSYRLHKASGRAVCTINGKDHYLGAHGSPESKLAYEQLINEWKATGGGTTFRVPRAEITLAMLMCDYLEFCEGHYPKSSNSETDQTRCALRHLMPYASLFAADLGPVKLKAVRQAMVDTISPATGKPLSRQYINKMVDRIVRMYRWAVENELVEPSIHHALSAIKGLQRGRTPAPEAPPVLPVDDKVVEATLKHCPPVIAAMIELQLLTAMRPSEVCSLRPGMIERSGEVWVAKLGSHKSAWRGKSREVYFGPRSQEVIRKYLLRHEDSYCFSPIEVVEWRAAQRELGRMTPLSQGNRRGYSSRRRHRLPSNSRKIKDHYETSSYGRAIKYACMKAFPTPRDAAKDEAANWRRKYWWSPNQLRHNAATRIRRDFGLEAAQVILGHSSADVTQVYAARDIERALAIASQVG